MPRDSLDLLVEYTRRGMRHGPKESVVRARSGDYSLRPELAEPITEQSGVTTMRVFCCGFDTVGGSSAVVR